jgi:hypothetical protein
MRGLDAVSARSVPLAIYPHLFAEDRYQDAWNYIQHADGKIHMQIPVLLDELRRIQDQEPNYTSGEFPFVFSVGERRSFTANVIIRNPEWRRRDKHGALRISPTTPKGSASQPATPCRW